MAVDKTLYGKDSIESLSPLEFTRLRPGVYAGDTTYSTQLLVEILSNAIDEFRLGHGNKIIITLKKDIVSVQDFGQGFLVNEKREDGTTVLEAAFSVLNTSGKYREDGTYEGTSLGSFGIGSKITNYLSHYLDVTTYRDGKYERLHFTEGVFDNREVGKSIDDFSGTVVEWRPSEEFFTHTEVEINKLKELLETTVALCPGLTIELNDNNNIVSYYSSNGISDLADKEVKNKELIDNRLVNHFQDGKYQMDMVLTYTTNYSSNIVAYVNTGLTESGPHISQIKATITREFNKFFKEKKWLKEKDENLSGDDIQEGLYLVFNLTAPGVAYDAQVKTRITKIDMKPFLTNFTEALNTWFLTNEKEVKMIADKAINAKKARDAAKKARDNIREKQAKKEKAVKFDSKLADCYSKNRSKCEIYITEGK